MASRSCSPSRFASYSRGPPSSFTAKITRTRVASLSSAGEKLAPSLEGRPRDLLFDPTCARLQVHLATRVRATGSFPSCGGGKRFDRRGGSGPCHAKVLSRRATADGRRRRRESREGTGRPSGRRVIRCSSTGPRLGRLNYVAPRQGSPGRSRTSSRRTAASASTASEVRYARSNPATTDDATRVRVPSSSG
jgi:hypothetical protein